VEFRILGPLEVCEHGRSLQVGGAKQRALLAVLLLSPNRVVSTDRLIDAVWDERPPETAAKSIHVYVSQLRRVLGRERIETRAPGYLLRLDPGELDLHRCEALLEEAKRRDPDAASAKLREALALWRGPALADFGEAGFAQREAARLEELQLTCLEARLDADLARGRAGELVGELERLVADYPLRERLRAQLMLALYRSGRQSEALEAYQAARRALVDELGIEPGRGLRELEQAILRQDPRLELDLPAEDPGAVATARSRPKTADNGGPAVVARPPEPAQANRQVRKTVTVVFADVSPADDLLDPELLRSATARSLEEMRQVLERHGGSVEKLIRGPLTAVFGIPVVHEDDPLRAVRAAAEMRELWAALAEDIGDDRPLRLSLRTGVSTGEVVTGGSRGGDVVGHAVTVAARLQQVARPGEILIAAETHRFVRDAVLAERADDETAAPAFRLLGLLPGGPGEPSRFGSPLVGRVREQRRLLDAFEQAIADRSCQLFTILGTAGVGKSRLVQEVLTDLNERALVIRGRCLPYGEGITYWPLVEAVKDAAALDESASADASRRKLAELLEGEDDADLIAQRVAELVGMTEAVEEAEERSWAVRSFFEALARRQPLAVVFDDIHWGQPTFLELVEHVTDSARGVPLLIVCIARPELLDVHPGWGGGKLNATTILLEPLSEDESAQLIDNLAGEELDTATRRRVISAAEGNPLFV
jgi:DNA-binding SARP family transcriptional activator